MQMYQALYRKWLPRTFDEVTGQAHITETLKRQVVSGRLSHAYLFTGTRGTGKTSCAKILSRAVNCEHPINGNPCNQCPACLGIENGSILDVLELDAASNNGVDQVRALRDEAVYTPAAVRKRVYIVDEVHMLSPAAFNALLKILEEPPDHLMFILATTELHKVPATIKSRCQQFAFQRILPGEIAQRLTYVAQQENIPLTAEGAALLARLADGGLRDALSLLDQCSGVQGELGEQQVLDALGLVGTLDTARLMERIAGRDVEKVMEDVARLYGGGKEVSSILGELAALTRDLLLRKTAPNSGKSLMTGGFDETAVRSLLEQFSIPRLVWMLSILQRTLLDLPRSANRRTDAELCLVRLCDETLDDSVQGLTARLDRLERQFQGGCIPSKGSGGEHPSVRQPTPSPGTSADVEAQRGPESEPHRPAPAPERIPPEPPREELGHADSPVSAPPTPTLQAGAASGQPSWPELWAAISAEVKGQVSRQAWSFLNQPEIIQGTWASGALILWTEDDVAKGIVGRAAAIEPIAAAVQARVGHPVRVSMKVGRPPEEEPVPPRDRMDDLLAMGQQFSNIIIKE